MSQFNALTGPELLEYLLSRVRERLEETGEFRNNVTFPWVKYEFSVKLLTYPKNEMVDAPKQITNEIGTAGIPPEGLPPETVETMQAQTGESGIVDTPDQARVDSNQPIPTTTPGPGNVLIDKPVMAQTAPAKFRALPTKEKGNVQK